LYGRDSCACDNQGTLVAACQFVLQSPGDVEEAEESHYWCTCEDDGEGKDDSVDDAENDGTIDPCGDMSVLEYTMSVACVHLQ